MPELPEVETVVRTLEKRLRNTGIQSAEIYYPKLADHPYAEEFTKLLEGEHFRKFERRGKFIILTLDRFVWVAHLRMEGKFLITTENLQDRHIHMKTELDDGRFLYYKDTRKFGRMELYRIGENLSVLNHLGYEPFDERVTAEYLKTKAGNRPLKEVLLDQSVMAGIGNIYANEIAFAIGRRPSTRFSRISKKDTVRLIEETRRILREAIKAGGTTVRSYSPEPGVTGLFQLETMVHGREGEPCRLCGTPVKKVQYRGRGTYYCVRCQK